MASAAAVLLLASLLTPQPGDSAGVLLDGAVRIVLYGSYARVIGLYAIDRNGAELRFDAMRSREQLVLVDEVTGPGLEATTRQLIELRRLVAPSGTTGAATYRIVYSVSGDLTRLPLFVPNTRVDRRRTELQIEVIGHDDGIELPVGDPAFHADAEGVLIARPPALPPFVTLREPRSDLLPRPLGWIVLLALLAVAFAMLHRASRSKRPARSKADDGSRG